MSKSKMKKKVLLSLMVLIISCIIFLPVLLAILTSFKSMAEIQSVDFKILPEKFLFSNYIDAMKQGEWPRYFSSEDN